MDECTWCRNGSEGVKTLARRVGGADRDHNTGREGKEEGPARMSKGSIGQMGVVEPETEEAADEFAVLSNDPPPPMAVF